MADFCFIHVNQLPTWYDFVYRRTPHSPKTACFLLMALRVDLINLDHNLPLYTVRGPAVADTPLDHTSRIKLPTHSRSVRLYV